MDKGFTAIKNVLGKKGQYISPERNKILLSPHINPDGDAVGSTIGFAHLATTLGFDVRIFLLDDIPATLAWLPNPFKHVSTLSELGEWAPDIVVTLDCGDSKRAGSEMESLLLRTNPVLKNWQEILTINIDHHMGNPEFANLNWVEPLWSSTGQLVGHLAEEMGVPLQGALGQAIYLTLVSDTGGFSFGNTTGAVLHMAGRILDNGMSIGQFTSQHENHWTENRLHAWGELMQHITLHAGGTIASATVSKELMDKYNLQKDDLEGLAALLRKIKGVKIAVYLREDAKDMCKLSLRSTGDVNVNSVAKAFGGGGHKSASGAELHMGLQEAREAVLAKLAEVMKPA